MPSFNSLCEPIKNKIINKLGWRSLTTVQEMTIPRVLNGDNCIVLAPTAGGKTEAAFFPTLSTIYEENIQGTSIIYVSPIKALLNNQEERINMLSSFVYLNVFKWHGDVDSYEKSKSLENKPNVLMTTPESLEVILMNKRIDNNVFFKNIRFLIIDEIHSFADSERGIQLMSVMERIQSFSKYDIQRIGLSATVGNPNLIGEWMQGSSKRTSVVIDPPKEKKQRLIEIKLIRKNELLEDEIVKRIKGKKSLFFCNSRSKAEGIKNEIENKGINTYVHHSSIDKRFRESAEEKFKLGTNTCIIATSTLELGIDIGNLDLVVQLDSPKTVSSFLQRLGRTGRRKGTISHYVFFPSKESTFILAIAILQLTMSGWVEDIYISKYSYDLLFHQIITMSLAEFGVDKDTLFNLLNNVYSYSGIDQNSYYKLLEYMIKNKYIQIDNNKIFIDDNTEKTFGKRNFMEIYSTFETNKEFTVKFRNRTIGTLERWFVNALGKDFQFILAGKYWQTDKIDYDKFIIYVIEAKSAMPPKWMSGEGFYSLELSQSILKVISSDEEYSFLNDYEKKVLEDIRYENKSFGLEVGKILIEEVKEGYYLYTYAGNKINYTLANAIVSIDTNLEAKVIGWDGFKLMIIDKDNKPKVNEIIEYISKIKQDDYLIDKYKELVKRVPNNINTSKYTKYLPDDLRRMMIADYIYDIVRTNEFIHKVKIEIY